MAATHSTHKSRQGSQLSFLLQVSRFRPREVEGFAQRHTARKWQSWDASPDFAHCKPLTLPQDAISSVPSNMLGTESPLVRKPL